ncbi:MAG: serine hydrolase domain-containing protein [Chryseolinea sp.]
MNPSLISGILAVFVLSGSLLKAQPQEFSNAMPEDAGFSAEHLKRLDVFLETLVKEEKAPNIVTFVARHGKVVHQKAYGFKNVEKKQPAAVTDIYRLASQTKAITTTAMMILYEEGKFLLEDPVSKYIPAFEKMQVFDRYDEVTKQSKTHPAKTEITIKHLLSHTAGISYGNPVPQDPKFKDLDFLPGRTDERLSRTIPLLAKRPLSAEPGSQFIYGPNIDVIGYLIEILSGMSLDEFFKNRIFDPLGMKDTYFYLPADKANRLVELYAMESSSVKLQVNPNHARRVFPLDTHGTNYLGGAGLVGPIEDYAKFCQMIVNKGTFNGKQILSRKTIALMSRNQIGDLTVWDRNDKFGLGFMLITENTRYADQASPGSLTWGGMFSTEYTIDPTEDLIMLVYTNVDPYFYERELERKFRILVYQALK